MTPAYRATGKQVLRADGTHFADAATPEAAAEIVAAMNGGWRDIADAPREAVVLVPYPHPHHVEGVTLARLERRHWRFQCTGNEMAVQPQHWMPLPTPPRSL